ncbi:hypothetical protein [Massilibacteroides sp.]|uniref:hypothetical protein n=1 Tax=Massilibacteroides sp. TaxID=2034766 RepID=UPI00260F8136|nr:hypothetical protein [Massilibacteroides sp.]MDD4514114.1 hypothetical protein [Massilibacteroides sp.]
MTIEIIAVSILAFLLNIPLGRWRTRYKKLSLPWWLVVHASIPFIIAMRIWLGTPRLYIPLFIALAVLGQFLGARAFRKKQEEPCE